MELLPPNAEGLARKPDTVYQNQPDTCTEMSDHHNRTEKQRRMRLRRVQPSRAKVNFPLKKKSRKYHNREQVKSERERPTRPVSAAPVLEIFMLNEKIKTPEKFTKAFSKPRRCLWNTPEVLSTASTHSLSCKGQPSCNGLCPKKHFLEHVCLVPISRINYCHTYTLLQLPFLNSMTTFVFPTLMNSCIILYTYQPYLQTKVCVCKAGP